MVANQSVEFQDNAEMYCNPTQPSYGEYYSDTPYYITNPPSDLGHAHICTIHRDYGPVTVPMVSTNASPPVAMPIQVAPGHVVQQIVDENGRLRHVILSPHNPGGLVSLPSQNYVGDTNGTSQSQRYQNLSVNYPPSPLHTSSSAHTISGSVPLGPSPPPPTYYKDERAQKQHIKLKKKLYDKQIKTEPIFPKLLVNTNNLKKSPVKEKSINSVETSEDGEESSIQDDEDSVNYITEILSSVQAPSVSDISPRSALLQWTPPTRLAETACNENLEFEFNETDLTYEVLLSDKSKEMKFKSIYRGSSLSCRIQDLKPGQEYSVCLQVHFGELQGSATDPIVKFTTPPCEPDKPQAPKLVNRTKNSFQIRWNAVNDNGSHVLYYLLEYDDGGGEFVEIYKSKGKQHTLQKLRPSTAYKLRLAAVNEVGKSAYSDVVTFFTFDNPPAQPNPPTLIDATPNSLNVQWNRRVRDDDFVLQLDDPHTGYGFINVYNGNDTRYMCKRLHHCTNYKFRLRAQNDSGYSAWSSEVQYTTLPDRPMAPSKPIVKGRIHAHSFKLRWDPPFHSGGAEIDNYVLEVNSGSGYSIVYTGKEVEAICDKLTPGTTYQLRVSCFSKGGHSNFSDPCTVTTDAICPAQCTSVRLSSKPRPDSITLDWCEPDYNGGAPVLEYEVEMTAPDSNTTLVHKKKQLECTVGGLKPGTDYEFKVRAVNRIGPGLWTEPFVVRSGAAPPDPLAAPALTCKSPSYIFAEWRQPECNGASISEYRLEMCCPTSNCVEDFYNVYQGFDLCCDIRNLVPFTTYNFRVQAANVAGCGEFSPISTITTPAAAPSAVAFSRSSVSPTSIALCWNEPITNGSDILYYNIEVGDRLISTETPVTEFTIEGLQAETHYKIRIQAINEVGESPFSTSLKLTTLRFPPAPPKLNCIGSAHNYLKLKWGEGKNVDYTQYCVEMENSRSKEFQCVYRGTSFSCKVNKLQELTTYKFRINATNDAGEGDFSDDYEFATMISPPSVVKAPKIVELEDKTYSVEWVPSKNSFTDSLVYDLQVSRPDEASFSTIYKGPEYKYHLKNLDEGNKYGIRVASIRLASTGELPGPFSTTVYLTVPVTKSQSVESKVSNRTGPNICVPNNRNVVQLFRQACNSVATSEKYRHLAYATAFTMLCIFIAVMSIMLYEYVV